MDTEGLVIVFGSLILVIALIVSGAIISGPIGHGLLAIGILGALAWLGAAFYIANAMNTDI